MEVENAGNGGTRAAMPPVADPGSPSSRLNEHVSKSLNCEYQLMKVPYEQLKKSVRASHRLVEKEMNAVIAGVAEAVQKGISKEEAVQHFTTLVSRLQGLKRKLDESSKSEQIEVQRSRARLDHLERLQFGDKENQATWNNVRIDRILVDYMLRASYYETAIKLAKSSGIQDLVDIDIFLDARRVIQSLQNKECSEALAWCIENKAKLKKSKSNFEFKLRLQEFIELVREERMIEAINYAREYLASWGSTNMKELQQAMATLAFKSNTECAGYKVLFDAKQWDDLIQQFKLEFYKLYGMTTEALLNIYLQAGLSALKTPFCYEEGCMKEDPLSQETFRQLAEPLPFSKHVHSKLVCFITKEIMDEDNPPMVLPNGFVYSKKALEEMAKVHNGKITCPRSGFVCSFNELSKAYIS